MDRQVGSLTSLHPIAATIVVILHFADSTLPQAGMVLSTYIHFFRNGYLCVEFIIYLMFPFILFSLLKTKLKTDLIIYLSTLVGLFLLIKFTRDNLDTIIGIPSIARCVLEYLMGAITYKLYRSGTTRNYLKDRMLAVVSVMWVTWIMHNWIDNFRGLHDWSILPAFSLLILSLTNINNGSIAKLMNSPVLLYLGTISYSIYLVHWVLAELLKTFWCYRFDRDLATALAPSQSLLAVGLLLPIVFLSAALTYRCVEVPMRNRLRPKAQLLT